jgi:hypothetical protein
MITKTMLQIHGPHLQQDITSKNQTKSPQVMKSSGHPQVMKYSSSKPQVVNSSQNPKVANSSSNPQIMKFCYPQVTNPS